MRPLSRLGSGSARRDADSHHPKPSLTLARGDDDADENLAAEIDLPSSIDSWLAVFSRLLRLPEQKKSAICEELREHLIERVRDLELAGTPEPDAIGAALAELGETAALARRFDTANRPNTRRMLMYGSFIGAGAGAVALAAITWTPGPAGNGASAVFQTHSAETQPPASFAALKIDGFSGSLGELIPALSAAAHRPITVRWNELNDIGVATESEMRIEAGLQLTTAFDTAARQLTRHAEGAHVVWRFGDDLIELGPRDVFDREDLRLISYDIAPILGTMGVKYNRRYDIAVDDVVNLITTMVSPFDWHDNGGDLAHQTVVGGRLFIEAPPRMHERVQWLLDELSKEVEGERFMLPKGEQQDAAHVFPLGFVDAAELAAILNGVLGQVSEARPDPRTNSLIIRSDPAKAKSIEALMRRLDRAE